MERKFKVAEMATVLGVVPKTIYKMIDREELRTVIEKVNNRQTTLIITNDEEIEKLKQNYSKYSVNGGNYYENVTVNEQLRNDNESNSQVKNNENNASMSDAMECILALNNQYNEQLRIENERHNEQLEKVNEQLVTYKAQMLLLEDSKNREGFHINEINELRKGNEQLKIRNERLLTILISAIVIFVLVITGLLLFNKKGAVTEETSATAPNQIEQTSTISKKEITTQKPVKKR